MGLSKPPMETKTIHQSPIRKTCCLIDNHKAASQMRGGNCYVHLEKQRVLLDKFVNIWYKLGLEYNFYIQNHA